MRSGRVASRLAALFAIAWCGLAAQALAQTSTTTGVPNALQGFSQNRNQPVQIEAASLEVRDRDKVATFAGNVSVTQGETNLRAASLVVFYDQEANPANMKAAKPGPAGSQQIRRLEAKGGVVVTNKDQRATGETGIFDMRANTVTLHGNVLVTQGTSVLKGDRLVVDLTNGVSRIEGRGRVQGLFIPKSEAKPDTKPEAKPEAGRAPQKPAAQRQSPIY